MKKLNDLYTFTNVKTTRVMSTMEKVSTYKDVVLDAVNEEYGKLKSGSKVLAKIINISHRSVEGWFCKRSAPDPEQLIELMVVNDVIADRIFQLIEDRKQKRRKENVMD